MTLYLRHWFACVYFPRERLLDGAFLRFFFVRHVSPHIPHTRMRGLELP